MRTTLQSRALFTCFVLAAGFTLLSFRLVHVQVAMADEYSEVAAIKHGERQVIHARRGIILDRNAEPLAQNEPVKTVIADGSLIRDADAFAALLAGPLEMPVKTVSALLKTQAKSGNGPCQYITLKKEVAESTAIELAQITAQAKIDKIVAAPSALWFEQDFIRIYPNGSMACHALGYTNGEHVGVDGVERTMNQFLAGNDGFRYTEHDRVGREMVAYRGQERPASDGLNVVLTVDMGLQNIVEQELAAAVKQYKPKSATVILMDPKTGGLLALANWPNFDLNKQGEVSKEDLDHRRNRAISDTVEPGSIFKIVTTAAALTERLVKPDTWIFCENGYWSAYKLKDHRGYSSLTVHDGLVKSSNIMMAKMGIQLGDQKFYEYVRKFGFGDATGVMLPGEVKGIVHPPHLWSKLSITRMTMGHEVTATPVQLTAAMCAIANGGNLMLPQIVERIEDGSGRVVTKYDPQIVRRVASPEAADLVRQMLIDVVGKKGTAQLAAVPGYTVAGKTGTAQKIENGRYSHEKYVVSFLGFLPAEDPAFVGLVMIDDPRTERGLTYGGLVSAPVFSKIGEKAARYLHLPPNPPEVTDALTSTRERAPISTR